MEYKLEIIKKLEELAEKDRLDDRITILNLPAMFLCEKMCNDCYFTDQEANLDRRLSTDEINQIINYFGEKHDVQFVTINGRGDPFHPSLLQETLGKIRYASSLSIQSYVFTAGDNLDEQTIASLAEHEANVMISLFGNRFIDADFFSIKQYEGKQAIIANNLRKLIMTYNNFAEVLPNGITRLGMNYVVGEKDLSEDGLIRLAELKQAANENRIYFQCNTNFNLHPDPWIQRALEELAVEFSNFEMKHSLAINGVCRMGAASSVTVDYDETLYQCPYMKSGGSDSRGNFFERLRDGTLDSVLKEFSRNSGYTCVLRKTKT